MADDPVRVHVLDGANIKLAFHGKNACFENFKTRQVTAIGIRSAASSRTSGNIILERRLRQISGRPAQNLDLLPEQLDAFPRLPQLDRVSLADTGLDPIFDVRDLQPPLQAGLNEPNKRSKAIGIPDGLTFCPLRANKLRTNLSATQS